MAADGERPPNYDIDKLRSQSTRWAIRAFIAPAVLMLVSLATVAVAAFFAYLLWRGLSAIDLTMISWLRFPTQALSGMAVGLVVALFASDSRQVLGRSLSREMNGELSTNPVMFALAWCEPGKFDDVQVRRRRTAIRRLGRIASAIDEIPSRLKLRDPDIVRAAYERGHGVRALQTRVAYMDTEDQRQALMRDVAKVKDLYDAGRWYELSAVAVELIPVRHSALSRVGWSLTAAICTGGIIAIVVLVAMGKLPSATATYAPFLLTLFAVTALTRLGVAPDFMKQVTEVATKTQGAVVGKPEEKKDGS